jgi:predicted nucleic acid-binding protein
MQPVVLDTDVFSFFFKRDSRARLYEADITGRRLCLCFQTIAEIKSWAILRNWSQARRDALERVLSHYVVLPYDSPMADAWASATAHRQHIGRPLACGDAWIAAAAIRHAVPLLTHNSRDFAHLPGLNVISHA